MSFFLLFHSGFDYLGQADHRYPTSGNPMFYVYVIKSREGRTYIGSTENVEKRLKQHNAKSNRGWTNRFHEWQEVYREEYETRLDARRRERELKKMRGSKKYKELTGL
jgi:putative endonuclease